jgi:hypothetical protein
MLLSVGFPGQARSEGFDLREDYARPHHGAFRILLI